MRTVKRILAGLTGIVVVGLACFAIALSYEAPCEPAVQTSGVDTMRAVVARCYGSPEVLRVETLAKPEIEADQVLVKVHSVGMNPLDWHSMRGEPYVMRMSSGFGAPTDFSMGVDFSGRVAAVGKDVTKFKVGDAVFGGRGGALADYVAVRESRAIALKPENVSFEEAAGVAIAASTALQALRDTGQLKSGQTVLINGASGGVGTFAVQLATWMGAEVTGVCSTRNVDLVRSLGAKHVVDYTQANFTEGSQRFDLILDNIGNHSPRALHRMLKPGGTVVIVGANSDDPWIGAMWHPIKAAVYSPFVDEKLTFMMSHFEQKDFELFAQLLRERKLRVVVDRQYPFDRAAEAIAYLETGRARGKVIVNVNQEAELAAR